MGKKGQAFIIGIWVLSLLSVLAVGIGYRAQIALKLSQYHRDRLKSRSLALAGLKIALYELNNDEDKNCDTINDRWFNNEAVFQKVSLEEKPNEFASIGFVDEIDGKKQMIYGIRDEEGKINLNTASEALLAVLFQWSGIANPDDVARNVLIWRGEIADAGRVYEELGYAAKKNKFVNNAELVLVKGLDFKDCQNLKKIVTVVGDGKVNINTASDTVLGLLLDGLARQLNPQGAWAVFAKNLSAKIVEGRRLKGYFSNEDDLRALIAVTGDEETNLMSALCLAISFKSDDFLIEVSGNVGKIKSGIEMIYCRSKDQILFWYET